MTEAKARLLILGATSDIGLATARRFARDGHPIMLAARSADALERDVADLTLRGSPEVSRHHLDILDTDSHAGFLAGLPHRPDIVLCVIGLLGDQTAAAEDPIQAAAILRSNFEGPALLLGRLATEFEARGRGCIIGISSVAGDRGRASNYLYGAAKAGFTAFLSGLRNRLCKSGVQVLTVKPGFVRTRMIEGMRTPAALTAQPEEVAEAIHRGWTRDRNVIYVRPVWWLIMAIIRAIPEQVFKRLSL